MTALGEREPFSAKEFGIRRISETTDDSNADNGKLPIIEEEKKIQKKRKKTNKSDKPTKEENTKHKPTKSIASLPYLSPKTCNSPLLSIVLKEKVDKGSRIDSLQECDAVKSASKDTSTRKLKGMLRTSGIKVKDIHAVYKAFSLTSINV